MIDAVKLTHRPTGLPGGDPGADRTVMMEGRAIGRVTLIDAGQQGGQWSWSCLWIGGGRGVTATLDAALGEIKALVADDTIDNLPPEPPPWNR